MSGGGQRWRGMVVFLGDGCEHYFYINDVSHELVLN